MPTIRPITDLKKHAAEIFRTCLQDEQPVFLTKNGHGKLVVMSQGYFDRMQAMMRLYTKLEEARKLSEAGDQGVTHKEMMRRARARVGRRRK